MHKEGPPQGLSKKALMRDAAAHEQFHTVRAGDKDTNAAEDENTGPAARGEQASSAKPKPETPISDEELIEHGIEPGDVPEDPALKKNNVESKIYREQIARMKARLKLLDPTAFVDEPEDGSSDKRPT
jgi:hypothetical protein